MKLKGYLLVLSTLCVAFTFQCCTSDTEPENLTGSIPTAFKVDIPSSLSQSSALKGGHSGDFSGREIYQHLNNFIHVGESAAEFIEDIMKGISTYGLNKPMDFPFTSQDDQRVKNVLVINNAEFEGSTWQHQLTISDANNEANDDGGVALQVFWNTNPVKGLAILKPKNWDASGVLGMDKTLFRVDYSEAGEHGYTAEMTVYISHWEQDVADRFHMDNLKMFVGKNGDIVDVFGNSNHPDAWLFLEEAKGFSWAFVASGNDASNIGVAEVGLPLSTLDESRREVLLEDYSIKKIFTSQISEYWYRLHDQYPDSTTIAGFLTEAEAPGFFNSMGFIQGGLAPSEGYEELLSNIHLLAPFSPLHISQLQISFK